VLVNWPVEKVVAEIPEMMKAAEMITAIMSLRIVRFPHCGIASSAVVIERCSRERFPSASLPSFGRF
jgi:hypothetical protein